MTLNMKYYDTYINFLNKEKDCIFCQNKTDKNFVIIHEGSEYNYDFVNNNSDLERINAYHEGGVIILKPKDIALTLLGTEAGQIKRIINKLIEFFKEKGMENLYWDNNDILIDEKKLFSCMETSFNDLIYGGFYLSFDTDINLIRQICTKPMIKEPVGLSQFNIAPEEVIGFLESIIQEEGLNIVKRLEEDN